jgi:hypothetical protein
LDPGAPVSGRHVDAAEARLGFPLPPAYRELVTGVGPVAFGDNSVPSPTDLVNAHTTILRQWSYGDGGRPEWLSEGLARTLRGSVLLFFEVGDGMGADLYLPPPNRPCGDRFATFQLHEESLSDDMESLGRGEMECVDFEDRLRARFARHVRDDHASALKDETGEVLIDTADPADRLVLRYATGGGTGFEVELE